MIMASIKFCIILVIVCTSRFSIVLCFQGSGGTTNMPRNADSIALHFGLEMSLNGDQQSTGALAGVHAALNDINSRNDLLSGFSLHYTPTDSQVIIIMQLQKYT